MANALKSAQPKIQKMCEEESDDQEAVAKLFEINDSIHRTIERYNLIKKGDIDGASKIPKGTLGTSTGVGKNADNELSLIDFDADPPSTAGNASAGNGASNEPPKAESLEDDLLGLSFQDKTYGQTGGIALGFGANTSESIQSKMVIQACLIFDARCAGPNTPLIIYSAKFCQISDHLLDSTNISGSTTQQTELRPLCQYYKFASSLPDEHAGAPSRPISTAETASSNVVLRRPFRCSLLPRTSTAKPYLYRFSIHLQFRFFSLTTSASVSIKSKQWYRK